MQSDIHNRYPIIYLMIAIKNDDKENYFPTDSAGNVIRAHIARRKKRKNVKFV